MVGLQVKRFTDKKLANFEFVISFWGQKEFWIRGRFRKIMNFPPPWKGELAKKRPVRNPSEEKAADKEAENIEKLDVACLWCSAVLRNEALAWDFIHIYLVTSDHSCQWQWSAIIGHILTIITIITVLTQFHSVTRVVSNSNLAKAKSAFSGHDTTTLKVNDAGDNNYRHQDKNYLVKLSLLQAPSAGLNTGF